MADIDLAVLGQDPRYGGGAAAQLERFLETATELGRRTQLMYASHPALASRAPGSPILDVPGIRVPLARVAAAQPLLGRRSVARRLEHARSVWVAATTASYGAAAALTGRPYGCWIGTTLQSELRAQRRGLPRSRRLAAYVNSPVLRRIERDVLRRATAVYATSASSRAEIADASGLDEVRVGILPIPVDVNAFLPIDDAAWRDGLTTPTLLFVGRASDPRKNVGLLLRAFPRIRKSLPEARLVFVGTPPGGTLPAGVSVAGHVHDLPSVLANSTLLVLPSLQEGFAIVVAEALAAGVPVLTTPCGGPEEMLRSARAGTVLAGFTEDEFAMAAVSMLEDPDGLAAARKRGREFAERELSLERFRQRLERVLAEVGDAR